MSNNKACSEITLPQVGGLITDLLSKLMGKKGKMWVEAFRRFLRKENSWNFKIVMDVPRGMKVLFVDILDELVRLDVDVFPNLKEVLDTNQRSLFPIDYSKYEGGIQVVAVKLKDFIPSLDVIGVWGYTEIIEHAKKSGFIIPDASDGLTFGLKAVAKIISLQAIGEVGEYFVCSELLLQTSLQGGEDEAWLPRLHSSTRTSEQRKRCASSKGGAASLRKAYGSDVFKNPEAILIFFWED